MHIHVYVNKGLNLALSFDAFIQQIIDVTPVSIYQSLNRSIAFIEDKRPTN